METNQILQADVLDILFEVRNKMYGAYELRRSYNKRLKTAMAVMIGCCLFAFLATVAGKNGDHPKAALIVNDEVVLLDKVKPEQPPVPPLPPSPPPLAPKPIAMIKLTTPILVENTDEPQPTQSQVDNIAIGLINRTGEISDVVAPPIEEHSVGNVTAPQVDDFKGEVFFVQKEAQFPGGAKAWTRFLERNLQANTPSDNGAPVGTYTVVVSFLVDKEGNLSEVKAENDPGYGTAAEAVRAIQKGPKWIPAVQNGRNVIYRQKQTITFKVEEAQ